MVFAERPGAVNSSHSNVPRFYHWEIVGYIPFQIPSNLIITKVSRPGLCKL